MSSSPTSNPAGAPVAPVHQHNGLLVYSDPACISCHRVRLVIAEKDIEAHILSVSADQKPAELAQINPLNSLPTLVDRDLVLYGERVIIDYLDERYPHPPFMPIDPVSRARHRLALYRLELDWLEPLQRMERDPALRDTLAKPLAESLSASVDVFQAMPYFLSEEYSILDATLAPLLWRLPQYGIVLPKAASPISDYARRMFARPGFQASLSDPEREMGL